MLKSELKGIYSRRKTTNTKIQAEMSVPDLKGGDNKSTNDNVDTNDHTKIILINLWLLKLYVTNW